MKNGNLSQTDMLHVNSFQTIYKQLRRGGMGYEESFVSAIVLTSDHALAKAKRERPELVQRWNDLYGTRKNRMGTRKITLGKELQGCL